MDRNYLKKQEILKLQERSAASRMVIRSEYVRFCQRLDVPARVLGSLREQPSRWMLGTTALGLAAGFIFPKFRSAEKPAPRPPSSRRALRFAWSIAEPIIKTWALNQLRMRLAPSTPTSPFSRP